MQSQAKPSGALSMSVLKPIPRPAVLSVNDALRYGGGPSGLMDSGRARVGDFAEGSPLRARMEWQRENEVHFGRSIAAQAQASRSRSALTALGHLWLAKVVPGQPVLDLGLASCRVVTSAGVNYIVDAFQNLVELENLRYHGLGTSSAVETVANTALGAEFSTQYATNNFRATGTTGEQSGNPNVYETTALVTVDATVTATEHGLFSRALAPGGVLFDRTVFAGVPLASGESLQCTYQFTLIAGG